jgi:predicted aspartyl protease
MGAVRVEIEILSSGARAKSRSRTIPVLVDTGAALPVLPAKILGALGFRPTERVRPLIADGRRIRRETGNVRLRLQGREVWSRVIFGKPRDPAVLGLTVLEQLGLTVDPRRRRLVPTEILLLFRQR